MTGPLIRLAAMVRRAVIWWPTQGVRVMVQDQAGCLLLVRHRYGRRDQWTLPGGGIGRRETPDVAARREVLEETGCRIADLLPVAVLVSRAEGRRDTVHLFRAHSADRPRADAVEVAEARFFSLQALPATLSPATQRRIDEAAGRRVADGSW